MNARLVAADARRDACHNMTKRAVTAAWYDARVFCLPRYSVWRVTQERVEEMSSRPMREQRGVPQIVFAPL